MSPSSNEAVPAVPNQRSEPEAASLIIEEVQILRKLASAEKRWWQDYSVLIAAMAFFLSLSTSVISAWTSYRKDIHDQQAQLARLTQAMQDLLIQQFEVNEKYKNMSPEIRHGINNLMGNQYSSILKNAISGAFELGSNATTGELTTIGLAASEIGNFAETLRLLDLAVSAANSAVEKSYALRVLGHVQIRFGGSAEMRTKGDANFKRALDLDSDYPDLKLLPVSYFLKIAAEQHWSLAYAGLDCTQSTNHNEKAQEYMARVPLADSVYVTQSLRSIGVDIQGTTITAPPGCAGAPESQPEPTGNVMAGQQELKMR